MPCKASWKIIPMRPPLGSILNISELFSTAKVVFLLCFYINKDLKKQILAASQVSCLLHFSVKGRAAKPELLCRLGGGDARLHQFECCVEFFFLQGWTP